MKLLTHYYPAGEWQHGTLLDWLDWLVLERDRGIARGKNLAIVRNKRGDVALALDVPLDRVCPVMRDPRPGLKRHWVVNQAVLDQIHDNKAMRAKPPMINPDSLVSDMAYGKNLKDRVTATQAAAMTRPEEKTGP